MYAFLPQCPFERLQLGHSRTGVDIFYSVETKGLPHAGGSHYLDASEAATKVLCNPSQLAIAFTREKRALSPEDRKRSPKERSPADRHTEQ